LLNSLADFAAIAIRHQSQQRVLRQREKEAARAAIANQLAHQINNPLQSVTNAIYLATQSDQASPVFLKLASDELERIVAIVRELLSLQEERKGGGQ
jgi:nitrogen-specific signal transduction histidine kinase